MVSNTRKSLIQALSYCALRELPPVDNGEDVWIKALALVSKTDGCDYFVCVEKKWDTLENRIVKDFGPTGAIRSFKAVYPYLYLDARYMPNNLDRTKESRISYLKSIGVAGDFSDMGIKDLNNMIVSRAIKAQLTQESNNEHYDKYHEYYEENGAE